LKIALYHSLPSGGAKRAVQEWTRRLGVSHSIDVFTHSSVNHDYCDIRPFVQRHRIFDFQPRPLFASPFGRLNQLQRWRDLGDLVHLGEKIAREIDTGGYDVIFAHPCLPTYIPTALLFTHIPSVYYLHEPFGRTFTRPIMRSYQMEDRLRCLVDRIDPLIAIYYGRLASLQSDGVRKVTRLLANSEYTRQWVRREFRVDAPVLLYGVNADAFHPLSTVAKENLVISVGEMTPRKGFDFLVESLAQIPESKRPELELVSNFQIPEERVFIETLAAAYGVKLRLLSNLDANQLTVEYNRAKLCVYSPVMEPFGLVPLEAMACGTPVVGVREGGVPESVHDGETGILTQRDPQAFAEAVTMLLGDEGLCRQYGKRAREYVQTCWSWENSVHELEKQMTSLRKL
jgi:glycosyltransferase involved in cell wall biosynthesis